METNVIPAWHYIYACIGNYYQCAKFHACIKKCTIHLQFRAMLPYYFESKFERIISFIVLIMVWVFTDERRMLLKKM